MFKRIISGLVVLAMLMSSACSEVGNHARTSAVHDGMRALGLVQMPDGTYAFRLCEMAESYTPEVLEKQCINPLSANDGLPLVFTDIPARPGTLVARVWNWGITLSVAAASGLLVYGLGRYIVKVKAINELSRGAYAVGLQRSLEASKKYQHFELPARLRGRLLTEVEIDAVVPKDNIEPTTVLTFVDKLKLKSGKEVEIEALLTNKKLQKSLKKEEAREISELLTELEETLSSGSAYVKTLTRGLNEMSDKGMSLADGVLGKIVHEHDGRLILNATIEESLHKNRLIDQEYHEALQQLDAQVAGVLGRQAKSISSRQRNIARLEVAAGLDEVLKVVEGVGDRAIVVAQKGDAKLLALTENNLRNMIEELGVLVKDGSKGADEVKDKLANMREQLEAAVGVWEQQAEDLADTAIDTDVVRGMDNFIKTTRKKMLKGWRKSAKDAQKELQKSSKTPAYETGAKAYEDQATNAVHSTDSVLTSIEVKETGQEIVRRVDSLLAASVDTLGDHVEKLVDGSNLLRDELEEVVRKANYFGDLRRLTLKTVNESSLFKSAPAGDQAAAQLVTRRDEITAEIKTIIKAAQDKTNSNKVGFFTGIVTRLRNFKLKDNKIFHYWDKNVEDKLAIKITDKEEVIRRLANHEEVGEARVEKGVEKLLGHLAGATTFVAIPITALRQKLSGHARVSAASRWGDLTGSYELTAEGRVDDMRTIIEGIAAATGAKVSDEVFYFMLRSGLRDKQ